MTRACHSVVSGSHGVAARGSAPNFVIAGGGTGGHLMPGLAVARALQARGAGAVTFIGTARGLETRWVPEAGFPLRLISIGGLKSGRWRRRLASAARLPWAVVQSLGFLRALRPRAVLGIGGYASGPVLAAAALLRIPIVLLEVNASTGLANRWAARWANAAAVNFPATAADFPRARVEVTGVPVRPEFIDVPEPPSGRDLSILVTGGSQGAHALNQVVMTMAPQVAFGIVHQTGPSDAEACAAAYASLGGRCRAAALVADMAAAMSAADLVVCRSGASTLAELAAARRPAILIPFPGAADQHQLHNAEAYASAGAAVVLEQSQLTPERLASAVSSLLASPARLAAMRAALAPFAHPGAAEQIADLVLTTAL